MQERLRSEPSIKIMHAVKDIGRCNMRVAQNSARTNPAACGIACGSHARDARCIGVGWHLSEMG